MASMLGIGSIVLGLLSQPARRSSYTPRANGRMEAQPSFFEEKPPPSWSSPEWKWGSADGVAHTEAAKARQEFDKPFRRSSLLSWAKLGSADYVELKMVLALKCQHAKNGGYDAPDGRWAKLEAQMAAAYADTHRSLRYARV